MMRHITAEGIKLIQYFEGFSSKPYRCSAGYLTIGYGHLIGANENLSEITEEEGRNILIIDVWRAENSVIKLIHVPLRNNQFDALVDFCFNLGGGALQRSAMRQKINREEHGLVPNEFRKWIYGGGRKLNGLIKRRNIEAILYSKGGN